MVTITTSAAHGLSVGEQVTIAGVGVTGYNGDFVVTSVPTTTTFTYTDSATGLAASGGGTATAATSPTQGALQEYLNLIPALNGNVQAVGPTGGPFDIIYSGALANRAISASALAANVITGGTTFAVSVASNGPVSLAAASDAIQYVVMNNVSEQVGLYFPQTTSGGTFSLTFVGMTVPVAFNSSSPATTVNNITSALSVIPGVAGNVTVAWVDGWDYTITFSGLLANVNVPDLTAADAGLTGTAHGVTVVKLHDGVGGQSMQLAFGGASGTVTLSYNGVAGSAATALSYVPGSSPSYAQVLTQLATIPALNGNIGVVGPNGGPFLLVFLNNLATTSILSPSAFSYSTAGGNATAAVSLYNDPPSATAGNFGLSFNGYYSQGIVYSTNFSTQAANIQAGLNADESVGAGNAIVTPITPTVYEVLFQNDLGHRAVGTLAMLGGVGYAAPVVVSGASVAGVYTGQVGTLYLGLGPASTAGAASLTTGSNVVQLTGTVQTFAQAASNTTAQITGGIDLSNAAHAFNVAEQAYNATGGNNANGAAVALDISAAISGLTGANLTFAFPGQTVYDGSARATTPAPRRSTKARSP